MAAGRKQPLPPLPTWTAPKTTQTEALHTLFDIINTRFQVADFLIGLERAFKRVGLKPRGDGSFSQWSGSGLKGFVCKALAPAPCAEEGFTAAEAAAPVYMEQPPPPSPFRLRLRWRWMRRLPVRKLKSQAHSPVSRLKKGGLK